MSSLCWRISLAKFRNLKVEEFCIMSKPKCIVCRRYDSKSAGDLVVPLPEKRVVHVRPFYFSGVDYAGSLTKIANTAAEDLDRAFSMRHHKSSALRRSY